MRLYHDQFAEIRAPIQDDLAEQRCNSRLLATIDQHIARSGSVIATLRQTKTATCQNLFA